MVTYWPESSMLELGAVAGLSGTEHPNLAVSVCCAMLVPFRAVLVLSLYYVHLNICRGVQGVMAGGAESALDPASTSQGTSLTELARASVQTQGKVFLTIMTGSDHNSNWDKPFLRINWVTPLVLVCDRSHSILNIEPKQHLPPSYSG